MIFFIIREVIGWILIAGSLYLIQVVLAMLEDQRAFEASVVAFIFAVLLKAGMQLVRVSTAARICAVNTEEKTPQTNGPTA